MAKLDGILAEISATLEKNLPWLDIAFGKAERVSEVIEGKVHRFPAIYKGKTGIAKNEYLSLVPNDRIGNFSFFYTHDPQRVEWTPRSESTIRLPFSLIFWFDLRKVYEYEFGDFGVDFNEDFENSRREMKVYGPFPGDYNKDFNRDFENSENIRNLGDIKDQILKVLSRQLFLTEGRIQIEKIWELAENIYEGFTLVETDNQFLMHPYAGFRFEGTLTYTQPCY